VEEGAVYKGSPEMVRFFYEHGVRESTLTWNFENELAFPNRAVKNLETGEYRVFPETERGLKKAGQDVVQLMEELGMLIDVSHL
jgi:membrane dipeptidase